MSFIETPRFPDDISYGGEGGPGFNTTVITVASGFESRNVNWQQARCRFDVAHAVRTEEQFATLLAFFRAVQGKANGFRYKDWSDFQVAQADSVLLRPDGTAPGIYQLARRYTAGALSHDREIRKPVSGTVTVYKNAVAMVVGTDPGEVLVDTTNGRITRYADGAKAITAITKANPGVFTCTAHGFSSGDLIGITGVLGMTEINNQEASVTVLTADTFHLGINTSAYGAYTSGGTASKFGLASDALTWAGEFDVPCRFDTDELNAVTLTRSGGDLLLGWQSVPLVEIRT